MTTEIVETKIKVCNVCGSDGSDGRKAWEYDNKSTLVPNPGYGGLFLCGRCYSDWVWRYLHGLRRLGVFGTIQEPRKETRTQSDEVVVQWMLDDLIKRIRERKLNITINLGTEQ